MGSWRQYVRSLALVIYGLFSWRWTGGVVARLSLLTPTLTSGAPIRGAARRSEGSNGTLTPLRSFGVQIMNKCNDCRQFFIIEVKRRHSFIRPPLPNDRSNSVALHVLSNRGRGDQVRTTPATAGIASMADAAPSREQFLTSLYLLRCVGALSNRAAPRPAVDTLSLRAGQSFAAHDRQQCKPGPAALSLTLRER